MMRQVLAIVFCMMSSGVAVAQVRLRVENEMEDPVTLYVWSEKLQKNIKTYEMPPHRYALVPLTAPDKYLLIVRDPYGVDTFGDMLPYRSMVLATPELAVRLEGKFSEETQMRVMQPTLNGVPLGPPRWIERTVRKRTAILFEHRYPDGAVYTNEFPVGRRYRPRRLEQGSANEEAPAAPVPADEAPPAPPLPTDDVAPEAPPAPTPDGEAPPAPLPHDDEQFAPPAPDAPPLPFYPSDNVTPPPY